MLAFGPTVNRNSFLVSPSARLATKISVRKHTDTLVARLMLTINSPPAYDYVPKQSQLTLWQRAIQSHLVKHLFLLPCFHQELSGIEIVGMRLQYVFEILDVAIHVVEILLIARFHHGRVLRQLGHHLIILIRTDNLRIGRR